MRVLLVHPSPLGLRYMFLGVEAIDAETLKAHRKRVTPNDNLRALEVAHALDINVAINLIADPDWDERQYADHERPITYAMRPPAPPTTTKLRAAQLYVHTP